MKHFTIFWKAALAVAIALTLAGCEKARLDQEVDRLCRIDGGTRVYETVPLGREDYDEKRGIVFPQYATLPGDNGRYGSDYYSTWETTVKIAGDPQLARSELRILRRSDGKVLGEQIVYFRRGGDVPNPFHPSSYGCPSGENVVDLAKQVFVLRSEK